MTICYPQIITSMDLLQSTIRLDRLGDHLSKNAIKLAALTNSTLYGVQAFHSEMVKRNIQPIIGLRYQLEINEGERVEVVSYARTQKGWKNLLKLSSAIETRHVPAVPQKWFTAYSEGLVSLLVTTRHVYPQLSALYSPTTVPAITFETATDEEFIAQLKSNHPFVMPYAPAQLETKDDQLAYRLLQALDQGKKLHEVAEPEVHSLYSTTQWEELFAPLKGWDQSFYKLFSSSYSLVSETPLLPKFPMLEGANTADYLRQLSYGRLEKLMGDLPTAYQERLDYELSIIEKMGYSDYFLIVQDFIHYAKSKGISVGPGRGSSASSLVAYALGITGIDPLEYGLLFERFLNPERVSLPDIDVDFTDYRRDEVIAYVRDKYGAQYVAQILAFGTLSTKAVAREVARVMEFSQETLSFLSKAIPSQVSSLQKALAENKELQAFVARDEKHALWLDLATRLEGMPRNVTVHAAGVIISPVPLVDVVPIEEHQDGMYLTQWTMKEVEAAGLLKMDFLGLRNLTLIEQMTARIRETENVSFRTEQIDREDKGALKLLASGDTLGVFQFESAGMRKALTVVNPESFREVVAVNALFRPGPMAFIPNFAARKKGQEKVSYPHPSVEPILRETYGIIVYQEQIMQIARAVAGYTYAEADLLRRAVSKKDRAVLMSEKKKFVDSARRQQVDESVASNLYELIVRFSEYGFPKSHATAYSLIAMQMAYIKAHYPKIFYATLLTSSAGNRDKQLALFREMKRRSIPLLPPDLWKSSTRFTVDGDGIRIGLSSIKGISKPFLVQLLEVRKLRQSPWKSLFELASDLSAVHFTRQTIEPLIKAGALDFLRKDRAVLLASLDPAVMHAELVRPSDKVDLLSGSIASFGEPKYTESAAMPTVYKLAYEKEVVGTYISTHPVEEFRSKLHPPLQSLDEIGQQIGKQVNVIGLLKEIRKIRTKKGQAMAFAVIEDERDELDLTFFPETFAAVNVQLKEQQVYKIQGKLDQRNGRMQLIVSTVESV